MALTLLTGKTGSGKSYEAVSRIIESLDKNRRVFTNIQMTVTDENYHYMDELDVKVFLSFIDKTFKSVENLDDKKAEIKKSIYFDSDFFIDEAHLVGFRDKKESILNWLTLQRHFNQNIYVITQVASNIHRDYLMMFHTHVDMIPPNKRLSKSSMGYREFDAYKGERLRTNFFKPKTDIFEIYNSGNIEQGMSQDVKKVIAVFLGLLILALFLFSNLSTMFDKKIPGVTHGENNKTILTDNTIDSHDVNELVDLNITYPTVICSTLDGCFFDGLRFTFDSFLSYVKDKYENHDTKLVMKSRDWQMYKFTLKDEIYLSK